VWTYEICHKVIKSNKDLWKFDILTDGNVILVSKWDIVSHSFCYVTDLYTIK